MNVCEDSNNRNLETAMVKHMADDVSRVLITQEPCVVLVDHVLFHCVTLLQFSTGKQFYVVKIKVIRVRKLHLHRRFDLFSILIGRFHRGYVHAAVCGR